MSTPTLFRSMPRFVFAVARSQDLVHMSYGLLCGIIVDTHTAYIFIDDVSFYLGLAPCYPFGFIHVRLFVFHFMYFFGTSSLSVHH